MPAEPHFRAFARRAVTLAATVATGVDDHRPARLLNIGLGGACVEVRAGLDVGAAVTLELTAPNLWDPLIVPAKVAWIRPSAPGTFHAGFTFIHTTPTALPALVELLVAYHYE